MTTDRPAENEKRSRWRITLTTDSELTLIEAERLFIAILATAESQQRLVGGGMQRVTCDSTPFSALNPTPSLTEGGTAVNDSSENR